MTELENRIENVISTYIQEYQGLVFSQIYQDIVALTITSSNQGFLLRLEPWAEKTTAILFY